MATMAIDADETEVAFVSGGLVAKTAPMMNIILAIQMEPPIKLFLRPQRSIPTIRKMAVATTLTVP
jgi:hypothetical protein